MTYKNNAEVSKRFRTLRSSLGMSQSEFANSIQRTGSFVALIESGKSNISEETVSSVCNNFHVNKRWLLYGSGEMFQEGYEISPPDRDGIPSRIKMIRKEHHLSQSEFAKKISCSQSQLSSVEQGHANPSNDLLRRISKCFLVKYQWLISGTGDKAEDSSVEESVKRISNYMTKDDTARSVVLEAIQAYSIDHDDTIWERIRELLS